MRTIIKKWKKHDFNSVYTELKEKDYEYKLENLMRDFKKISSIELLQWIVCTYENNPDSLFLHDEMKEYKAKLRE